MKKDNPLLTIAVLIAVFSHIALAYTNWGTEMSRSFLAVFSLFWSIGIGIVVGMDSSYDKR